MGARREERVSERKGEDEEKEREGGRETYCSIAPV